MIIEKKRLLKMFYYLIAAENVVRAKDIADYAEVSERTVKNDLEDLKNFAMASGCALCSKKGQGYWIEVVDQAMFDPVKEQLYYQFSELNYTKEYETRANEIARRLLVQQDYMKLDDLADQMYLSRSSIKNAIREVRKILSEFKLELVSKPGHGVKVEGLEINIRFCMLELFINHHATSVTFLEDSEYLAFFETDLEKVGKIRQILLKTLRESENRVCDHYTHRIVRYISVMNRRNHRGYMLRFKEGSKEVLKSMVEHHTAANILKHLKEEFNDLADDENEIFGLELLLLMWNDLTKDDPLIERYPLFYRQVGALTEAILLEINERWNVDLNKIKDTRCILISCLIPIYTRLYFHAIGYKIIGRHVENNGIKSSPISMTLAQTASEVIERQYQTQLSFHEIQNLAVRLYVSINKIQYEYKPRKVLLSAQSGNQACEIIKDKMLSKFGKEAFESIDIIGFYEVRRLNQQDYDYMILNFGPFYYRYDLPMIYVDSIPNEKQMNQIYSQVILGGYRLEGLLNQLNFSRDFVFVDYPYENRKSFLTMISYKAARTSLDVGSLLRQLQKNWDGCVWNEIAFIMTTTQHTRGNIFEIYSLAKPGVWDRKTVKTIVYLAVDFNQDLRLMRFVEQFTHEIMESEENLNRLVSTRSLHQIYEIIKSGLRSG